MSHNKLTYNSHATAVHNRTKTWHENKSAPTLYAQFRTWCRSKEINRKPRENRHLAWRLGGRANMDCSACANPTNGQRVLLTTANVHTTLDMYTLYTWGAEVELYLDSFRAQRPHLPSRMQTRRFAVSTWPNFFSVV